jgi:nucleotide-binding universal stress UspA family protein
MVDTLHPSPPQRVSIVAGELASDSALREVEMLATKLGVLQTVTRVLPPAQKPSERTALEASRQADLELLEEAALADQVTSVLPSREWPATQVLRAEEGFLETVVRLVQETGAELVILTGVDASVVAAITELAHACQRPMLLARPAAEGAEGVLVATSMADDGIRVLRYGAELSRRLGAAVTVAHNPVASGTDPAVVHEKARAELETRASAIGSEVGVQIRTAVTSAGSPEAAIVALAAQKNWQLLVLGSYPRSWLTGWLVPSVCAPVVERVPSSVLVLPLPET